MQDEENSTFSALIFLSKTSTVQSRDYIVDSYQYCISKYLHYGEIIGSSTILQYNKGRISLRGSP